MYVCRTRRRYSKENLRSQKAPYLERLPRPQESLLDRYPPWKSSASTRDSKISEGRGLPSRNPCSRLGGPTKQQPDKKDETTKSILSYASDDGKLEATQSSIRLIFSFRDLTQFYIKLFFCTTDILRAWSLVMKISYFSGSGYSSEILKYMSKLRTQIS